MNSLKSKIVIVIGGSSGIGRAVVSLACKQGASVTLTSRSLDKAQKMANEIGPYVDASALDVNNEKAVNDFFASFSEIDHVYIAAGKTRLGSVTSGDLEDSMSAFNERILGSLRVVRAAVDKINPAAPLRLQEGCRPTDPLLVLGYQA